MIARFGAACAATAQRCVPHPFVFALLLNVAVLILGLVNLSLDADEPVIDSAFTILDAWYDGFWNAGLLAFAFQMALILVTGYVVADAPIVQRALMTLAGLWKTPAQAVALAAVVAVILSVLHWGLGLIGGAILAREIGKTAARRGQPIPYALIVAGAYAGFLAWHGGFSGSAPLKIAEAGHPHADLIGTVPVSQTLFSTMNLFVIVGLIVLLPLLLVLLLRGAKLEVPTLTEATQSETTAETRTFADRLETSRALVVLVLLPALALAALLAYAILVGARAFDLNTVLFAFLFTGLALHGSARRMTRSFKAGAAEASGILLQFPFYFAVMGVMKGSGLVTRLSELGVDTSTKLAELGLPAAWSFKTLTFFSAGLVNVFVPSGGGQWAVQGDIVLNAALDPAIAVPAGQATMALAHGDAWTNMLQPFWALALLSITETKARDIMGYTMALMVLVLPLYLVAFLI